MHLLKRYTDSVAVRYVALFLVELLKYCEAMNPKSQTYLKNSSWEVFKSSLLKTIVTKLHGNVIRLPEHLEDGMEAETAYDFRILVNSQINRAYSNRVKNAILMILSTHEICHISRIHLMNDGVY